jgi:hypothetical protein
VNLSPPCTFGELGHKPIYVMPPPFMRLLPDLRINTRLKRTLTPKFTAAGTCTNQNFAEYYAQFVAVQSLLHGNDMVYALAFTNLQIHSYVWQASARIAVNELMGDHRSALMLIATR